MINWFLFLFCVTGFPVSVLLYTNVSKLTWLTRLDPPLRLSTTTFQPGFNWSHDNQRLWSNLCVTLSPPTGQRRSLHRERLQHFRSLHRVSVRQVQHKVTTRPPSLLTTFPSNRQHDRKFTPNSLCQHHFLSHRPVCVCVCVCREGSSVIKHYHIKETQDLPKQFYLTDKHQFDSIPDLIGYHGHNAAGNVVVSWLQLQGE